MEYNKALYNLVGKNDIVYMGIWNKWKQINPDTKLQKVKYAEIMYGLRVEWHSEPISICQYGMRAALWRSIGSLLRKPAWIAKGKATLIPPWNIRHTQLEHIRYTDHLMETFFNGMMGYAPEIDTLFIYDVNQEQC